MEVLQRSAVRSVMVPDGELEEKRPERKEDFSGPVVLDVGL